MFFRIQHLGAEIHLLRDMMDPVHTGGLYDFLLTALEVSPVQGLGTPSWGPPGCVPGTAGEGSPTFLAELGWG